MNKGKHLSNKGKHLMNKGKRSNISTIIWNYNWLEFSLALVLTSRYAAKIFFGGIWTMISVIVMMEYDCF